MIELREEIAAMLQRRYGSFTICDTDPGHRRVSEGVDLTMRTLIDEGDEVIRRSGYVAYEADIIFAGGVPVPVRPMRNMSLLCAPELAAAITRAQR